MFRPNAVTGASRIHFNKIEDPLIQTVLREFLFARLNIAIPTVRAILPPTYLAKIFFETRRFCEYVRSELGTFDLSAVDHELTHNYAKSLINSGKHPTTIYNLLACILQLYEYRNHMSSGQLLIDPFRGKSPSSIAGLKHRYEENKTPRLPEQIIHPLLAWALKYVTQFSTDIFAARQQLEHLKTQNEWLQKKDAAYSKDDQQKRILNRLTKYMRAQVKIGAAVPVWSSNPWSLCRLDPAAPIQINMSHLELVTGASRNHRLFRQDRGPVIDYLNYAVKKYGVQVGAIDSRISNDDANKPWRPRFDNVSLQMEERMLQTACYILCSYLTGMRDSEVQAMRYGCLSIKRSEDGLIHRYKIRSKCFKQREYNGEEEQWVTIEPVAKAIKVLEQLCAPVKKKRGIDTLWPVLHNYNRRDANICDAITRYLNHFSQRLNDAFGADEPIIPPDANGDPWRLTTRQFRRTIAWHIANRPFGTVAGMIQYKHANIALFEGYAGSSSSGFMAEVETERQLGQVEDILTYFDEREAGALIGGPGAANIGTALDAAHEQLAPLPGMIADRDRLRNLLANLSHTLHVGPLADCFFNPNTARCLKQANKPNNDRPLLPLCEPTRCPNACITHHHQNAWQGARDDAQALLKEKRLSKFQRIALNNDIERIDKTLNSIKPPSQKQK